MHGLNREITEAYALRKAAMVSTEFSYASGFFKDQQEGSRRSAEAVVPIILDLIQPKSVLDVGCGVGTWLEVFRAHGAAEILGIDGPYVDQSMLRVASREFRVMDLAEPFSVQRRFDLVTSLEVAEHLPAESASTFVSSLVRHAPAVLFSAAVPHQGGTHHVNEQWQPYWINQFARVNYTCFDVLRRRIWKDDSIEYWYAQNMFLFLDTSAVDATLTARLADMPSMGGLALVHPRLHLDRAAGPKTASMALSSNLWAVRDTSHQLMLLLMALPGSAGRAVGRRLPRARK